MPESVILPGPAGSSVLEVRLIGFERTSLLAFEPHPGRHRVRVAIRHRDHRPHRWDFRPSSASDFGSYGRPVTSFPRPHHPARTLASLRPVSRASLVVAGLSLLIATSVACSSDDADVAPATTPAPGPTVETTTSTLAPYVSPIGDIIGEALVGVQFTTLAGLLVQAGLVGALRDPGPFTVFAPTDSAFAKVPAATLNAVVADPALLTAVLTYHVVAGEALNIADMESGTTLKTLQGSTLTITKEGGKTFVNGIEILVSDLTATNGVIHVIGGVLVPES